MSRRIEIRVPRVARVIALGIILLMPVAAWPGVGDTFTTIRAWLLALGTGTILAMLAAARLRSPRLSGSKPLLNRIGRDAEPDRRLVALGAWLAALGVSAAFGPFVSLETLVQELLVIAWACALAWAAPDPSRVAIALRAGACAVATWAILQWAGLDPWAAVGWAPARAYGSRMRVYGPLGNPNYVGAYLASMLPVVLIPALAARSRGLGLAGALLVGAAIVATGSRAAWLGAVAAAGWLAAAGVVLDRKGRAALATALVLAGLGVALGPARALEDTWRGRAHIWSVAAPHLAEHPLTGWGPGSFAVTYPAWEAERVSRGADRDVRAYAAAQRHAHNDYVERLSDLGIAGLVAWCALVAGVLAKRSSTGSPREATIGTAAAAGVAALAAVSFVDFPMQRPVERFTWWTLAVLATGIRNRDDVPGGHD